MSLFRNCIWLFCCIAAATPLFVFKTKQDDEREMSSLSTSTSKSQHVQVKSRPSVQLKIKLRIRKIKYFCIKMDELRILELFSGIGGMHFAFEKSGLPGNIVAAIDINPVANTVYKFNYPNVNVLSNNIQSVTPKFVEKLNANAILMSPPCQPFTRVGNKKDVRDRRTDALKHICDIMDGLNGIDYILMENVLGFEKSQARDLYLKRLQKAGFDFREFLLTPNGFGVPNSRMRYYCLAKRKKFGFLGGIIHETLPVDVHYGEAFVVERILEPSSACEAYLLPDEVLSKRVWLMDIVYPTSKSSTCFTKAYTQYAEGTGSVLCPVSKEESNKIFENAKKIANCSDDSIQELKKLHLRYFTPKEVSRLMCFPESFKFPDKTTRKQRYRLLGNSINVLVVSELIKLLMS